MKRIICLSMAMVLLLSAVSFAAGGEKIPLEDIDSTNYMLYEKAVRDKYGYNKGECKRAYLPHEEYYYGKYYDHWNVDLIYDKDEIERLFLSFEKARPIVTVKKTEKGVVITWTKVNNAEKYRVYRNDDGKWKLIATTEQRKYSDIFKWSLNEKRTYRVMAEKKVRYWKVFSSRSLKKSVINFSAPERIRYTNEKGRIIKIKWKKNTLACGYQVKCLSGNTMRVLSVTENDITDAKIGGLTVGRIYIVSMRSVMENNGERVFSKWSNAEAVCVRK